MSRDVSIREMQKAISDIRAWADGYDCPQHAVLLVKAAIEVVEAVLCTRDWGPRDE